MNWRTAVVGLVTALLGALVGPFFAFKLGIGPKQLEYRPQIRAPFIRFPDDLNQRLEIRHNGQPVKVISAEDIDMVNVDGTDTQEIELWFLLEDQADKPSRLLDVYMLGPKTLGSKDIVRLPDPGPGRVAFKLQNMKQWTSNSDYTYTARFLFEGDAVPNIRPISQKANWDIGLFRIHPKDRLSVFFVLSAFTSLLVLVILYSRWDSTRLVFRQADRLYETLTHDGEVSGMSEHQIRAVVSAWLLTRKQKADAIEEWWKRRGLMGAPKG